MAIFLDSGFFLGLLHKADPHHLTCRQNFQTISTGEMGLVYTSSFVIAEAATLILIRTKNDADTLALFREITDGPRKFAQIFDSTARIRKAAWKLFISHNHGAYTKRAYLSWVDASNIAFCRAHQIDTIITTDTDFSPYLKCL